MAKKTYDGILEAIQVDENNQLIQARIFEKHGAVWSDLFLVSRQELIKRINAGQKFFIGQRIYKQGSSFDIGKPLSMATFDGHSFLRLDEDHVSADLLTGVPRF